MGESEAKDMPPSDRERESFLRDLMEFHERRGTPFKDGPKIGGKAVDLHRLYVTVTSEGGWVRVNGRNDWDKVLERLELPGDCVNVSVAVKQVYLRYLDRYEELYFLGETEESGRGGGGGGGGCEEDEDSRGRMRGLNAVPGSYHHVQHWVDDSLRDCNGLSTDLYTASEYDKLALSLLSPLPNEQDFAINVCTLISHEGKHCLKLSRHPRVLHYLLAHAAVFHHSQLRLLFTEHYSKVRGHSLNKFWNDIVRDSRLMRLIDETRFEENVYEDFLADEQLENNEMIRTSLSLGPEDAKLFCTGRTLGTQEVVGQRVMQIATILRNLTFIQDNLPLMSGDLTFLRFVLLCCGSDWSSLHQAGWDMLGNVALDISVLCPLMPEILDLTIQGLESSDRSQVLSSLEVLNKLGRNEKNEEYVLKYIQCRVYERICSFLSVQDIMMLVYSLECLYSLTSIGEKACDAVLRVHGALDTLVALVTVEAQSYGPKACIQMKVVETVTGGAPSTVQNVSVAVQNPSTQTVTVTSTVQVQTAGVSMTAQSPRPVTQIQSPLQAVHTQTPTSSKVPQTQTTKLVQVMTSTPQLQLQSHVVQVSPSISKTVTVSQAQSTSPSPSQQQSSAQTQQSRAPTPTSQQQASASVASPSPQQVVQENERFVQLWLKSTFEPEDGSRIEQQEMYKKYIDYCVKIGRRGVIAPLHFPRYVRSVFGSNVGPVTVTSASTDASHQYFTGIRVRLDPLAMPNPMAQAAQTLSPLLKAQLSAPLKPNSTPQKMIHRPHQQIIIQQSADGRHVISHASVSSSLSQPSTQSIVAHSTSQTGTPLQCVVSSSTSSIPLASQTHHHLSLAGVPSSTSLPSVSLGGIVVSQPTSTSTLTITVPSASTSTPPANVSLASAVASIKNVLSNSAALNIKIGQAVTTAMSLSSVATTSPVTSVPTISSVAVPTVTAGSSIPTVQPTPSVTTVPTVPAVPVATVQSVATAPIVPPTALTVSMEPATSSATTVSPELVVPSVSTVSSVTTVPSPSANPTVTTSSVILSNSTASSISTVTMASESPSVTNVSQSPTVSSVSTETTPTTTVTTPLTVPVVVEDKKSSNLVLSGTSVLPGLDEGLPQKMNGIQVSIPDIKPPVKLEVQEMETESSVSSTSGEKDTVTVASSSCIKTNFPLNSLKDHEYVGNPGGVKSEIKTEQASVGSSSPFNGSSKPAEPESTEVKDPAPKKLMLADLLEKNTDKSEPPLANCSLRIGEKGLELVPGPDRDIDKKGVKRGIADVESFNVKKPKMNGNSPPKEEDGDETNVSSSAANLYAALAADALEDEPVEEAPKPPVIVTAVNQPRQIVLTAGGSHQIAQSVIVGGQHYIVAQPQTLVQGQPQTVLLAQAAQQQGLGGAKTIIFLQPQNVGGGGGVGNKVLVQTGTPPPLVASQQTSTVPVLRPKAQATNVAQTSLLQQAILRQNITKTQMVQHSPQKPQQVVLQSQQTPQQMVLQTQQSSQQTGVQGQQTSQQMIIQGQQTSQATSTQQQVQPQQPQLQPITVQQQQVVTQQSVSTGTSTQQVGSSQQTAPAVVKTEPQASVQSNPLVKTPPPSPTVSSTPRPASPSVSQSTKQIQVAEKGRFLCEWRGCVRNFKTAGEVYIHACEAHCPDTTRDIQCLWQRCDNVRRKRFSHMTHLYNRHCNPEALRLAAERSKQRTVPEAPPPPVTSPPPPSPLNHPGYAPNAALLAINRHASDYLNPKELQDENEGPVTKSIRLTSALILRNLVLFTTHGKRHMSRFEPHLANVALSGVESSRTIAQVLFDMTDSRWPLHP